MSSFQMRFPQQEDQGSGTNDQNNHLQNEERQIFHLAFSKVSGGPMEVPVAIDLSQFTQNLHDSFSRNGPV